MYFPRHACEQFEMHKGGGGGQLQRFRKPKERVFFWVVIVELLLLIEIFCASFYSIFLTAKLQSSFYFVINTLMDIDNED